MRNLSPVSLKPLSLLAALFVVAAPVAVVAQSSAVYAKDNPRFDISGGYQNLHANAPPALCQCFNANGGFVSARYWMKPRFGVTAEFARGHQNDISSLGQNLTLTTFLAGPHVAMPIHRITLFYELLLGEAHGSDSYFPNGNGYTTSASSFALAPGGGVDLEINKRLAVRAIQARYLRTTLPNGTSNEQNHFVLSSGVVVRFGHRSRWASSKGEPAAPVQPEEREVVAATPAPPPPPPPSITDFACTSAAANVMAGNTLEVAAVAQTLPSEQRVSYTWTVSGGHILGEGTRVTVDTASLPAGEYHVTGHAQLIDNPAMVRLCDIVFHVDEPPTPVETRHQVELDFKTNVHDIFFDLNKSTLRPEGVETLNHNAEYLAAHKDIRIQIGGFADERGASRYNLALGERRARAVRDALIEHGIDADRIELVTFGHDAQTCTAGTEECWQQNRRVGFLMQP